MSGIQVHTSPKHSQHRLSKQHHTCGCATKENTKEGTEITRCPCGAAYLKEIVTTVIPFTCYDCKRVVHATDQRRSVNLDSEG